MCVKYGDVSVNEINGKPPNFFFSYNMFKRSASEKKKKKKKKEPVAPLLYIKGL